MANSRVTAPVPLALSAAAYNCRPPLSDLAMCSLRLRRDSTPARLPAALAAAVCSAVLVACGSSSPPAGGGPTAGPALVYAKCMRAHGVPSFPDPSARGGLVIPNDINPQSPAFSSAQQLCDALPDARPVQTGSPESRKLQLLTLARCMRSHGVESFADPTNTPPPPSAGNAVGGNGWYLSLGTAGERQSPVYRRAAAACGASRAL